MKAIPVPAFITAFWPLNGNFVAWRRRNETLQPLKARRAMALPESHAMLVEFGPSLEHPKESPYSVSSNLDIYSVDFQALSASKENFLDDEQSGSELMFIQKDYSHSSKAIIAPLEQTSLFGPDRYHTRQRHPGVEIVDFTGFVKLKTSD